MISLPLNLRIKDQYISDKTLYENEQIFTCNGQNIFVGEKNENKITIGLYRKQSL